MTTTIATAPAPARPTLHSLNVRPLGTAGAAAVFGVFSLLTGAVVYLIIPWLGATLAIPSVVAWYVSGTLVVLLPMLLFALVMACLDVAPADLSGLAARLRLAPLRRGDLGWALGATVAVLLLTAAIAAVARMLDPEFLPTPSFLRGPFGWPVQWLLLAWLPLFVTNILGEELCWRGYLLPRQEASSGRVAWVLNGLLWCLFHWSFGWQIMLLNLPVNFILPAVVQRRRNTSIGILMHAVFNGGGFLVVLGLGGLV